MLSVNVYTPAAVGDPVINMLPFEKVLRLVPGGIAPDLTVQVKGAAPPLIRGCRSTLLAVDTVGSEVVKMTNLGVTNREKTT
jgi:hypothetical protein